MSTINGILTFIILLIALVQPSEERRFSALLFSCLSLVHYFVFYDFDGLAYYGSAALFDLMVILFTVKLRITSTMICDLHNICIASILLNGIGWVMWMLYMPPYAYNASFVALYVFAVITLIKPDSKNGSDKVGNWYIDLLANIGKGNYRITKL